MPNHKWAISVTTDAGSGPVNSITVSEATEVNIGNKGTASTCQVGIGDVVEVDVDITVANVVSFFMESDQTMRVRTNSETSPSQEFDLVAKKAIGWTSGMPAFFASNPLTVNITKLFFYNLGTKIANVQAGFLVNQDSVFS